MKNEQTSDFVLGITLILERLLLICIVVSMKNSNRTVLSKKTIALLCGESDIYFDLRRTLENFYIVLTFEHLKDLQEHMAISPDSINLTIFICDRESERMLFKLLDSATWKRMRTIPFWTIIESDDLTLMRYLFYNGIDDVFCFPIRTGELLGKLDRTLSRENHFEGLEMFCDLSRENFIEQDFTRTELRLLSLFFSEKGKEFNRHEITQAIWGRKISHHQKTLNVHLHNLRKKLTRYGYTILSTSRGEWAIVRISARSTGEEIPFQVEAISEAQFVEHHP